MNRLTVTTYNAHGCVGRDGVADPDRIAAVIREIDADVIGLQEINDWELERIAEATGLTPVAGETVRHDHGSFGNALLTRHHVMDVSRIDLSVPNREPRGILDVHVRLPGCAVRALVTHFGLRARERRIQADVLLGRAQTSATPLLAVLGDFNEWHPSAETLFRMHAAFGYTAGARSFPARFPLFALDRIWVAPRDALVSLAAHRTPLSRRASDHLPVCAVIDAAAASCPR